MMFFQAFKCNPMHQQSLQSYELFLKVGLLGDIRMYLRRLNQRGLTNKMMTSKRMDVESRGRNRRTGSFFIRLAGSVHTHLLILYYIICGKRIFVQAKMSINNSIFNISGYCQLIKMM